MRILKSRLLAKLSIASALWWSSCGLEETAHGQQPPAGPYAPMISPVGPMPSMGPPGAFAYGEFPAAGYSPNSMPASYMMQDGGAMGPMGPMGPVPLGMELQPLPGSDGKVSSCDCGACSDCCHYSLNTPFFIDSAIVRSQVRTRFDASFNYPAPDRAEFLWAQTGILSSNARGPRLPERSVDFQDVSVYLEDAPLPWFSGFVELPVRFVNPDVNPNEVGLGDITAGFKIALFANQAGCTTFQLRVYSPSGQADHGLGTGHVSIEPALLYYRHFGQNIDVWGEVRGWIPISDAEFNRQDYAGDIIRYGAGASIDLLNFQDCCPCGWNLNESLAGIVEFVGWQIIDGQGLSTPPLQLLELRGDSIFSGSAGLRYTRNRHSLGLSYNVAFSGDNWADETFRIEHRFVF